VDGWLNVHMLNAALAVALLGLGLALLLAATPLVAGADSGPRLRRYAKRVAIPCWALVAIYAAVLVVVALVG
jgi:hypothetical protein